MKLSVLLIIALSCASCLAIADSSDYYHGIDPSLPPKELKAALHSLISSNVHYQSYDDIWSDFLETDENSTGCIVDLYSAVCWTPNKQRCGYHNELGGEGQCYNREHTFPQSWWGGSKCHATVDLTHIFPADSYVNGLRGNLPLGNVNLPADYTSSNGGKIGDCNPKLSHGILSCLLFLFSFFFFLGIIQAIGYSGKCFEPAAKYKGDLARVYFYMVVRFMGEWDCCDEPGTSKASLKSWEDGVLRDWHKGDPVSDKEVARNNEVYSIQNNRSPFVDHPEWVDLVYFNTTD